MPTGIWSSQWRSGCAHWDLDCEEEAAGEEAEEAEVEAEEENSSDKSNNPHLAGGEKTIDFWCPIPSSLVTKMLCLGKDGLQLFCDTNP